MRWTKTKKLIEDFLCDKLKNRLKVYATSYNTSLGEQRRIWITIDGKEVFNASSAKFLMEHDKLWEEVKSKSNKPFPECLYECYPEYVGKINDLDYSMLILEQRNIFDVERVYDALVQYPNLSIDEALNSNHVIIQAFAIIDKRVGKRKLKNCVFNNDTHPMVLEFYKLRCEMEGLNISSNW